MMRGWIQAIGGEEEEKYRRKGGEGERTEGRRKR
jgi:hypothetical protein